MKILIVYYSRTGITRKVAQSLAEKLDGSIEEIKDKNNRSGITGYMFSGWQSISNKSPEIEEITYTPSEYDLVVIGTPVWAANMASPVRTYINKEKNNIKNYAVFCTYKGSGSKKTFASMQDLINKKPLAKMDLIDKEIKDDSYTQKLDEFIRKIEDN